MMILFAQFPSRFYLLITFLLLTCTHAFSQNLEQRIDSLLSKMSLQEKRDQLINDGFMTTPTNHNLQIPGFVMNDGPHGVRQPDQGTAFPTGIAMAATWDKQIVFEIGKGMGTEFHAHGRHQALGPCIDLAQDPRAGRNAETGGEDPYLCGQIGTYVTRGIQTTPVIATVKHFMVEGKQDYRHERNEIFTDRWASEHYGYNFRIAVQDGAAMSVMVAYNLINGVQASESGYLLDTLLRKRWGFPFYVVSDWAAVHEGRAAQAITAGTDLCMGNDEYEGLDNMVGNQISEDVMNKAVRNVLRTKILAGMLDYYPPGDRSTANSPEHRRISLESARKSIILLKNSENILPLQKSIGTIALIGPNADKANLNCFGSSETDPADPVSLKAGLEDKLGASRVLHAKGCDINSDSDAGFAEAKNLASQADVVIFAGGLDDTQEGEKYGGPETGKDRRNESSVLPGRQQDLIQALAAENPNVIAVIQSGGVCSMHESLPSMKGLVYSFYAGHDAGTAIADVLFGDYNPAGRMPVTMPTDDSQLPEWNDDFTDDYGCGYRWFDERDITPEYAFGFGLSYTTFAYSNLTLSSPSAPAGSPVQVSVDVENTGDRDGEEVVQLYVGNQGASIWMPKKELKGFERIALAAGEKKTVTFALTADEFYFWDEQSKAYDVNPGEYVIRVGGSSDNLPLADTLTLSAAAGKPDLKITEIFTMPRYPRKGEKVYFYAMVKNQGTASLSTDDNFSISFVSNSDVIAETQDVGIELNAGGARLVGSTGFYSAQAESFALSAVVDAGDEIDEWIENNNTYVKQAGNTAPPPDLSGQNVALNRPVAASSTEGDNAAQNVVDGNRDTRWESAWEDNQWIRVDLGSVMAVKKVIVSWETAAAATYSIQASQDTTGWVDVYEEADGNGGEDTLTFEETDARYIRLFCKTRTTEWGFSVHELEVFPAPPDTTRAIEKKAGAVLNPVTIHYSPRGVITVDAGSTPLQAITITDLRGRTVVAHTTPVRDKMTLDTRSLRSGVYIIRCISGKQQYTRKCIIKQ